MAICDRVAAGHNANGAGTGNGNGNPAANRASNGSNGKNGPPRNGGITDVPPSTPGEVAPQTARDWSSHIVGGDLLPAAIEAAERAPYPPPALPGRPPATIRSCLSTIAT